jgi:hypothetical protein
MQVLLRGLGMAPASEWRQIRKQLEDLGSLPSLLSQEEQQRLFLEVRGELRAELGFKTLLEETPDISASTSWPLVKRKVTPPPLDCFSFSMLHTFHPSGCFSASSRCKRHECARVRLHIVSAMGWS